MADDGLAGLAEQGNVGAVSKVQFDHIGLVVQEMREGREFLAETFGINRWTKVFDDAGIGVSVQFGRAETGPDYELIAPFGEASPVAGALRGGKNILNHVAYRTDDLDAEAERMLARGCTPIGPPQAAVAYGGGRIQFWMSPLRFLIELVEAPGYEHQYAGMGE